MGPYGPIRAHMGPYGPGPGPRTTRNHFRNSLFFEKKAPVRTNHVSTDHLSAPDMITLKPDIVDVEADMLEQRAKQINMVHTHKSKYCAKD